MKTFTYPQKNWVMTAALLAVLGLNVSVNNNNQKLNSGDFASTNVIESEIITKDGVMPIKYINNGGSGVLAIIPKKMTEGKVCDSCGYETIAITSQNKEDIKALNVQLLRTLEKNRGTGEAAVGVQATTTVGAATPEKKNPFESVEKSCKRYDEKSEALTCNAEKFIETLRRKSSPEIEKADALDFYKANIETAIRSQIVDARRLANNVRRALGRPAQSNFLRDSEEFLNDPSESMKKAAQMREDALKAVRTIISGIPAKYEDIRKALINAETAIATEEAREVQQTFIAARDSKDPSQGVYLFKEGELRRVDLIDLLDSMKYYSDSGLLRANRASDISSNLQTEYENYINNFINKMREGVWKNPYSFVGNTGAGSMVPGANMGQRISNPGRRYQNGVSAPQMRSDSMNITEHSRGTLGASLALPSMPENLNSLRMRSGLTARP
jgi:hypothetical protein